MAVLVVGWQGGEPFTAAAFVVFFSSRVARSIVKRPLTPKADRDPVAHANRFLIVTAAGWLGAGALAATAAFTGEGGEWLYVAPLFLLMGALQIVVMRWQGRSSSPRADAAAHRRLRRSAVVGATIAAVAVGAFAVTRLSERPARSVSSDKPPTLNHEVLSSTNANGEATVRVRNLDAFSWTRVRVFVSQGDEHVYACEVPPVVPPRGALTIDLGRCLSDEGLTVDTTRPVSTFAVRAAEGSIDSRRQ